MKDSYYSVPTIKEKKQKRKLSALLYYTQPFCACNLFLITTHFKLNKLSVTMQGIRKRTPQVSAVENHWLRSVTLFRLEIETTPPPPCFPFRTLFAWSGWSINDPYLFSLNKDKWFAPIMSINVFSWWTIYLQATKGARNPIFQVVITHASHVCSQHSFGLPLQMNEMHKTQFDHVFLNLLSPLIWSHVFWISDTWNLRKAQRWRESVALCDLWLLQVYNNKKQQMCVFVIGNYV